MKRGKLLKLFEGEDSDSKTSSKILYFFPLLGYFVSTNKCLTMKLFTVRFYWNEPPPSQKVSNFLIT